MTPTGGEKSRLNGYLRLSLNKTMNENDIFSMVVRGYPVAVLLRKYRRSPVFRLSNGLRGVECLVPACIWFTFRGTCIDDCNASDVC